MKKASAKWVQKLLIVFFAALLVNFIPSLALSAQTPRPLTSGMEQDLWRMTIDQPIIHINGLSADMIMTNFVFATGTTLTIELTEPAPHLFATFAWRVPPVVETAQRIPLFYDTAEGSTFFNVDNTEGFVISADGKRASFVFDTAGQFLLYIDYGEQQSEYFGIDAPRFGRIIFTVIDADTHFRPDAPTVSIITIENYSANVESRTLIVVESSQAIRSVNFANENGTAVGVIYGESMFSTHEIFTPYRVGIEMRLIDFLKASILFV